MDLVKKFVLEFFNIDCGFFVLLEFCYFYLFLWAKSIGTGFIITFALGAWVGLTGDSPVLRSFEPFIIYAGLSSDVLIFLRIVVNRFLMPCYFFLFYLYYSLRDYYCCFISYYLRFFWDFACDFFAWKELFKD